MAEKEFNDKYPQGTPDTKKDSMERYVCEKHGEPTMYLRDDDLLVHIDTESECT